MTTAQTFGTRHSPVLFEPAVQPLPPLGRVVAFGGGTGLPAVLRGLREASRTCFGLDTTDWLTAVVAVTDDGGSSGRLRTALGVLPPGDIRNCLSALVRQPSRLSDVLHDRFSTTTGDPGHAIGNLLIAALTSTEGDLLRAIDVLGSHMGISGRVLPATLANVHLRAIFEDGVQVQGETAIVARHRRIRQLTLERPVHALPDVIAALVNADVVIVGPGSLYTSVLPNLLVGGVAGTISALKATRVYVANLMTQPGETDGYSLRDHLQVLEAHTGYQLFDYVLVNTGPLPAAASAQYATEGASAVCWDGLEASICGARVLAADLAAVTPCGQIRHHAEKLGRALLSLVPPSHSRCNESQPV